MTHLLIQGDAARIPLPDKSVDLVFGSSPYCDARTYGIGAQRSCLDWVEWMLGVTTEAVRVSKGLVLWVCAGVTRDWCYWPACEGLLWEWWKRGGDGSVLVDGIPMRGPGQCWRPAYWNRVGIPGSGGKKWLRADVEYVLAFKGDGNDFWTDNTAMGQPPKFAPGGEMSHRLIDGTRKEKGEARKAAVAAGHGKTMTPRDSSHWSKDDERKEWNYVPPAKANPGNLIKVIVGGGRIGSILAHENEAPFPEELAEFFVRSFCPPNGTVLDPFSGSGTTCTVAAKFDRLGIGIDIRQSQCELGRRRIADSLRPVSNFDPPKSRTPLTGQGDLFAALEGMEEPA